MKCLVISHNCFSINTNLGKTMHTYFNDWNPEDLAQFYFHSEVPNDSLCKRYYRFTDVDALKSIFFKKNKGEIISEQDVDSNAYDTRIDSGVLQKTYQFGRKRKPFISYIRDLIWSMSSWNNKKFNLWMDEFSPEIVFLAAGDYAFPYKIALKISKQKKIPIVICCFDDYFINYQHKGEFFRKVFHNHLMKSANKVIKQSILCFSTNPKMSQDYEKLFKKEWPVLYTAANHITNEINYTNRKGISYLGNLGYNRNKQLATIGKFLKSNNIKDLPNKVDVYSNEKNPRILECLNLENGIEFHGSVSQDEVQKIISRSQAVLHVESFDDLNRNLVRYSLSTKIADSLGSGTPMIAFGPIEVASMDYLSCNKAAFIISSIDDIEIVFNDFTNIDKIECILNNAIKTARLNHSQKEISFMFINTIEKKYRYYKNENTTNK